MLKNSPEWRVLSPEQKPSRSDSTDSALRTQDSGLSTQHSALSTQHSEGTVLGFDFGLKRIGVAVGDTILKLAHPLVTIAEEVNDKRFAAIAALIAEWQPVLVVVGMPMHLDGAEHQMSAQCRRFARRLEGRFELKAVLVDERLSSASASEDLAEIGIRGRRQKVAMDQVAAQRILQSFLDHPHDAIA